MRVGGPKAAKRPRPERATSSFTLNTLSFEFRFLFDLPNAQKAFDRLSINSAELSVMRKCREELQRSMLKA